MAVDTTGEAAWSMEPMKSSASYAATDAGLVCVPVAGTALTARRWPERGVSGLASSNTTDRAGFPSSDDTECADGTEDSDVLDWTRLRRAASCDRGKGEEKAGGRSAWTHLHLHV